MKSKYVILASALMISVATFAQKDQIKAAEKALKNGNSQEAATILKGAEPLIANATDAEKAQFYFVQGSAYLDLANKNIEQGKNLSLSAKSFQETIDVEKKSGKSKYSAQAGASIFELKGKLINAAVADSKASRYSEGGAKLYDAYLLDKKDTINLYYTADFNVTAKEYDLALSRYEELKKLNYSGKGISYVATNKETKEENNYNSKNDRDFAVKIGTHSNPKDVKIPSKKGEIYKNSALILVQLGKTEEAKKALADAIVANPEDNSLSLAEANLYLDLKDYDTYKKKIVVILEKNPNDAELLFNLGTLSSKSDPVAAEKYFLRSIEIKPDYVNAYLNLAILKLEGEKKIIDEMSKLKNTDKDNKRYEVLKKEKDELYKNVLPYLEKAYALEPTNDDVKTTLKGLYGALEMTEKKKALK